MAFNLQKGLEATEQRLTARGFKLKKNDRAEGLVARVWSLMDGSGSTRQLWLGGIMQQAIQLVLPTAVLIDDDGKLPVAVFNGGSDFTIVKEPMTVENYEEYVPTHIVDPQGNTRIRMFGSTDYSPVLSAVLSQEGIVQTKKKDGWFKKGGTAYMWDPKATPLVLYFYTDGECGGSDEAVTAALLENLERDTCRVYVHFIGVGEPHHFRFIEKQADIRGNVGFVNIRNLATAVEDTDKLMEELLPDEMLGWLAKK